MKYFPKTDAFPRQIILDAIYDKVERPLYHKVLRANHVYDMEDLSDVLTKREYDAVDKVVRETFAEQVFYYFFMFCDVMGIDIDDIEIEDFDIKD